MSKNVKKKALRVFQSLLVLVFTAMLLLHSRILPMEWNYFVLFVITILSYFNLPLSLLLSLWGTCVLLFSMSIEKKGASLLLLSGLPVFYFIALLLLTGAYVALKFEPENREKYSLHVLLAFVIPVSCIIDRNLLSNTPLGTMFILPLVLLLPSVYMAPLEIFYAVLAGTVLTSVMAQSFCLPNLGMFITGRKECHVFLQNAIFTPLNLKQILVLIARAPYLETFQSLLHYFFSSFHVLFQVVLWGAACYVCASLSSQPFMRRMTAFLCGAALLFLSYFIANFLTIRNYPHEFNFVFFIFILAGLTFYIEDVFYQPDSLFPASSAAVPIQMQNASSRGLTKKKDVPAKQEQKIRPPREVLKQSVEEYKQQLKTDSENTELLYSLGEAYYFLGDFSSAREIFSKVLTLKPDYNEVHNYLAMIQYDEKRSTRTNNE